MTGARTTRGCPAQNGLDRFGVNLESLSYNIGCGFCIYTHTFSWPPAGAAREVWSVPAPGRGGAGIGVYELPIGMVRLSAVVVIGCLHSALGALGALGCRGSTPVTELARRSSRLWEDAGAVTGGGPGQRG